MSLLPGLRPSELVFVSPKPLVGSNLPLETGPNLPQVGEEKLSLRLSKTHSFQFRHRRFEQRFELVTSELPLHERDMLRIDADLSLFSAFTKHQMFRFDALIHCFGVFQDLSGLPGGPVQVLVGLQPTSPAARSESQQFLAGIHSTAGVR